VQGYNK